MRNKILFSLLAILIGSFYFLFSSSFSFEDLMGKKSVHWHFVKTSRDKQLLDFYRKVYEKNKYVLNQSSIEERIPKVIHVIWLGPKPFPESSKKNMLSWRHFHPDWKIKFWTDDPKRPCPIEGMEKHLLEEFNFSLLGSFINKTTNYGEKSDILRYEILFQEGGLYIDHDVKCYRSFDPFHTGTDFYVALEKPHMDVGFTTSIVPAICLIASKPHHPILQTTMNNVFNCWDIVEKQFADQPIKRVVNRTFKSFGDAVQNKLDLPGNIDLILPSSFFFAEEIFSKKQERFLRKKNLVWAKHSWDIEWCKPMISETVKMQIIKLKNLKTINLKQKNKIKKLNYFCFGLTVVNIFLFLFAWRLYSKKKKDMRKVYEPIRKF